MNWADQQPGESRAHWKDRTFFLHYGMGASKLREAFGGRMPQPGDTFTFNIRDGFADSFQRTPPSAGPTYSGRPDDYYSFGGRQWFGNEGETRAEQLLNTIEDWDQLGVELPELILVPTPNDEGVFVITKI